MNYVSWGQLHQDIANFSTKFQGKIVGIVGIPRSGTLAANLLGLHMNLPVVDIQQFIQQKWWEAGPRLITKQPTAGRVLLLDDSYNTGKAMAQACIRMGGTQLAPFKHKVYEIVPAVLYSSGKCPVQYQRVVPTPRVFAWNWMHAYHSRNSMWDFDGILCHDPTVAEDNEVGYTEAIRKATPLYLPTWPVGSICTHRLEKRRPITEKWLENYGVKVGKIIMRPENTCLERRAKKDQNGLWKGKVYKASQFSLFVESDPKQAQKIHEVSGKSVLCPVLDKMF